MTRHVSFTTPDKGTFDNPRYWSIETPVMEGESVPDRDGRYWATWEHTGEIKLFITGRYIGSYKEYDYVIWDDGSVSLYFTNPW